ncbi:MAG: hypothetical protein KTR27_17485 [Leptolyngbyaceae cyanobacterium MAG.088]|nr:hypothetical protein [Leptolyngbyaceae cyanobacterium MAG.088]
MLGTHLLTTLINLDRLGDSNPQLLRELKGRLKRFSVVTTIVLSLLCQMVVMLSFWAALPGPLVLDDVSLSTYPRIEWFGETQLSPEPVKDLLPADMANRDRAMQSGFVVGYIAAPTPVRGDKGPGIAALNAIQQGDRLIKIDGQLKIPSDDQLTGPNWQSQVKSLAGTIGEQTAKGSYLSLTPQQQKLIGTTIDLELYNAERGYYTVTVPRIAVSHKRNPYCLKVGSIRNKFCSVSQDRQSYQINWPQWYSHIYICLSLLIVFPLMGVGVFMLANNLADEKRRGTLNFLQLSPKSAFTILSGKVLGVPVCLYLAVGLLLPLHWVAGLNAGYGIGHLLGFYLTLLCQTLVVYLGTLLLSLSVANSMMLGLQPWLLSAGAIAFHLILLFYVGSSQFEHYLDSTVLLWFVLFSPFSSFAYFVQPTEPANIALALGGFQINFAQYVMLALIHAVGWYLPLGHMLERRFSNSTITLLNRRFSYPLTLIFAIVMLGLAWIQADNPEMGHWHLIWFTIMGLIYCVALMVALSPARQTLKDWTRFRHALTSHEPLSLWKDLLIGDASSPVIAIAINCVLLTSLMTIGFYSYHNYGYYHNFFQNSNQVTVFICCAIMFIGSILFSTVVSQTLLMLPRKKSWVWCGAVGSISCLAFPTLSLVMGIVVFDTASPTQILGMSPYFAVLGLPLSLLGTLTALLGAIHIRQLMRSGRSELQQLLS